MLSVAMLPLIVYLLVYDTYILIEVTYGFISDIFGGRVPVESGYPVLDNYFGIISILSMSSVCTE